MYRRLAEIAKQYLKRQPSVFEGKIQSRKYEGKDGIERTAYDIIVNEMKMLGGGTTATQSTQHTPPEHPRRQAPAAPAAPVEDIDDDVPFSSQNAGCWRGRQSEETMQTAVK